MIYKNICTCKSRIKCSSCINFIEVEPLHLCSCNHTQTHAPLVWRQLMFLCPKHQEKVTFLFLPHPFKTKTMCLTDVGSYFHHWNKDFRNGKTVFYRNCNNYKIVHFKLNKTTYWWFCTSFDKVALMSKKHQYFFLMCLFTKKIKGFILILPRIAQVGFAQSNYLGFWTTIKFYPNSFLKSAIAL